MFENEVASEVVEAIPRWKTGPPKGFTKRRDIFTREEVEDLLEKFYQFTDGKECIVLTAFLYITGCRIMEALTLIKNSFRFDDRYMYTRIRWLKTNNRSGTQQYRTLPAISLDKTPFLDIVLERITSLQNSDDIVFRIPYRRYLRRLQTISPLAWTHLFRHTRITLLAEQGWNEWQLAGWAGWAHGRRAESYVNSARARSAVTGMGDNLE